MIVFMISDWIVCSYATWRCDKKGANQTHQQRVVDQRPALAVAHLECTLEEEQWLFYWYLCAKLCLRKGHELVAKERREGGDLRGCVRWNRRVFLKTSVCSVR